MVQWYTKGLSELTQMLKDDEMSKIKINDQEIYYEVKGNPAIDKIGIAQHIGSMEGKEVRIGAPATAFWSVATTSTSNGSVNGMHDSLTPISGGIVMIDM